MIDITNQEQKCFANNKGYCLVYGTRNCYPRCAFYKPEDCEDWVRREEGDKVYLIEPEEYEEMRRKL